MQLSWIEPVCIIPSSHGLYCIFYRIHPHWQVLGWEKQNHISLPVPMGFYEHHGNGRVPRRAVVQVSDKGESHYIIVMGHHAEAESFRWGSASLISGVIVWILSCEIGLSSFFFFILFLHLSISLIVTAFLCSCHSSIKRPRQINLSATASRIKSNHYSITYYQYR